MKIIKKIKQLFTRKKTLQDRRLQEQCDLIDAMIEMGAPLPQHMIDDVKSGRVEISIKRGVFNIDEDGNLVRCDNPSNQSTDTVQ